jgi:6-phosphofructokinase
MLASMLGTYAVEAALKGETDVMAGIHAQKRCLVPLAETWAERKSLDDFMLHVQHTLA